MTILKGPVSIKENQGKLKEKRYIFLFNDCFLLTKIRQTNPHYFSKTNNFKYKTCVRLDSYPSPSIAEDFVSSGRNIVRNFFDYVLGKTGVKIIIPPGNYILILKTISEKESWMNELRGVLLNLHMKRSGNNKTSLAVNLSKLKSTCQVVLISQTKKKKNQFELKEKIQ